jgi:zinc protease
MSKVKTAIREELTRLLEKGVMAEEVDKAKSGYLQSLQVGRSDDGQLAQLLANNLSVGRDMKYYADLEQKIQKLTPQQIHEAFRKHIHPDMLFIAAAGDFSKEQENRQRQG